MTLTAQAATANAYSGLSGYPTSTAEIDDIISVMNTQGLSIYRMSFNPEWARGPHPYHAEYIQYFLDHCPYTIIVDRNHLYPPQETTAQKARDNWATAENSIFGVLQRWPNNQRVMVELINEYISSDFYSRMQALVTDIRAAGYTNPIVVNKWNQAWTRLNDALDNTYQGYHFYFNSWSVSGAMSQVNNALSKGIKLISTEVGADYNEYSSFTTSTVSELNSYLGQCASLGVGNTVWMNENLDNWPRYQSLGLSVPASSTVNPPPPPSPTPPPTTSLFTDGFESKSVSSWSSTTRTNGETVTVSSSRPYDGTYHARFSTTGRSSGTENAFIRESIDMQNAYARGYFRIIGSVSGSQILRDNNDRFYLLRFSDGSENLLSAGIRRVNGVNRWTLSVGSSYSTSSAVAVSADRWYTVEVHWSAAQGIAELFVDGTKILVMTGYGRSGANADYVDMGVINTYNVQNPLLVYGDCFDLSSAYNGPE